MPRHPRASFRSGSEKRCAEHLKARGIPFGYEAVKIAYTVPATAHVYTPAFSLENGVHVEVKGRWTV